MIANLLSQIADQQIQQNKILTGFYLDENQLAEIRSHLEAHAPHPDVGGLGRFQSVPVFSLDEIATASGKLAGENGIQFTYVQMDIVN